MTISLQTTLELKKIGDYVILRRINYDSRSSIYLARDAHLDRQVAIRYLSHEPIKPQATTDFKPEALLLKKLNHPHLVKVYDIVETPELLAIVTEWIDGKNLQQHLQQRIALTQCMQWLTQIAQGLAIAHDAGIVHQTLKAENILITNNGQIKISGFEIFSSHTLTLDEQLNHHYTNSYHTMSPEQAAGEVLDFRSNLFSFGVLAYQMLCGEHPFGDTRNTMQLVQRIMFHLPVSPNKQNPDLPKEMCDLLTQLLSKNADNRPPNAHWVAAQCEKISRLTFTTKIEKEKTKASAYDKHKLKNYSPKNRTTNKHKTQEFTIFYAPTEISKTPKNALLRFIQRNLGTLILGILTVMLGIGLWQLNPVQPNHQDHAIHSPRPH